jgi:hypothetical protein
MMMPTKPDDSPGSGIDKAPNKTLTDKITKAVKAIINPAEKTAMTTDSRNDDKIAADQKRK